MSSDVKAVSVSGSEAEAQARASVFKTSTQGDNNLLEFNNKIPIKGIDFNDFTNGKDCTVLQFLEACKSTGFQATNLHKAMSIVNEMREWRPSAEEQNDGISAETRTTIFLGSTSNLVSSGLRETIRYLVEHKHVHCVVMTAGAVEEDLIKCLAPSYLGSFHDRGITLRRHGLNRIGNLIVPNDNYCKFEEWLMPLLDDMASQKEILWSPSKMIDYLGMKINDPSSILYWAHRNNIPIFCPAITDGSLGDMIFFHSMKNPDLIVDIKQDICKINLLAMNAKRTGMIILGSGLVKHHICNANLMRNGADYAIYINTAHEFDGSDAGASVDEAISWGKIKAEAKSVKVHADASIVFPLLVASTFARNSSDVM